MYKEKISWEKFGEMCETLVEKLKTDSRKIDFIYSPPRGGLPIAVYISHHLEISMINHISWGLDKIQNYILVIDDVSDTGKTLFDINYRLKSAGKKTIFATLHYKPKSIVIPDYYVEETENWLIYPWECDQEKPSQYHQEIYPELDDLWDITGGKSIE